jgi:hypothetical protein
VYDVAVQSGMATRVRVRGLLALALLLLTATSSCKHDSVSSDGRTRTGSSLERMRVPEWGLICTPRARLQEVVSHGITMVRPMLGTEGDCDYRDGLDSGLIAFLRDASAAGIRTVLLEPDIRLWVCLGMDIPCSGLQTVERSKEELDSFFVLLRRNCPPGLRLICNIGEPGPESSTAFKDVVAYMVRAAHTHGFPVYIFTALLTDQTLWYYALADRLLITLYDVEARPDSTSGRLEYLWNNKRFYYAGIQRAYGGTVSPVVALHNWSLPKYGGTGGFHTPSMRELCLYAKTVAAPMSPDEVWFYCGNDRVTDIWTTPSESHPGKFLVDDLYELLSQWKTLTCE